MHKLSILTTSSSAKTLLLAGATGLVGQEVLRLALADSRVARIIAPTRRPLPPHARMHNPLVDFDHLDPDASFWAVDAVICTLGTTMTKAGSRVAFGHVDFALPLQVARYCMRLGAQAYALNSALGADQKSAVFYLRTKGELEQALREMHFLSLTLVRPGLLGGNRKESRPAERAGIWIATALAPILPRRYRVVPASHVAHHLLEASLLSAPGVQILSSEALL